MGQNIDQNCKTFYYDVGNTTRMIVDDFCATKVKSTHLVLLILFVMTHIVEFYQLGTQFRN